MNESIWSHFLDIHVPTHILKPLMRDSRRHESCSTTPLCPLPPHRLRACNGEVCWWRELAIGRVASNCCHFVVHHLIVSYAFYLWVSYLKCKVSSWRWHGCKLLPHILAYKEDLNTGKCSSSPVPSASHHHNLRPIQLQADCSVPHPGRTHISSSLPDA